MEVLQALESLWTLDFGLIDYNVTTPDVVLMLLYVCSPHIYVVVLDTVRWTDEREEEKCSFVSLCAGERAGLFHFLAAKLFDANGSQNFGRNRVCQTARACNNAHGL